MEQNLSMLDNITTWKYFQNIGTLAPHYHRKLSLKFQWHLMLVMMALKDLCICTGSQVLIKEFTANYCEDHVAGSEGSCTLWICGSGDRLLCAETGQWLTDWDVICALNIKVLWVEVNLLPSPTNIAPIKEKKFLLTHIFFHFLQEIELHSNLLGPLSFMWPIMDQNIIMQHMTVITGEVHVSL